MTKEGSLLSPSPLRISRDCVKTMRFCRPRMTDLPVFTQSPPMRYAH